MQRDELIAVFNSLSREVTSRKALGGYSADANGILLVADSLLKIVDHLIDQMPKERKRRDHTRATKAVVQAPKKNSRVAIR